MRDVDYSKIWAETNRRFRATSKNNGYNHERWNNIWLKVRDEYLTTHSAGAAGNASAAQARGHTSTGKSGGRA